MLNVPNNLNLCFNAIIFIRRMAIVVIIKGIGKVIELLEVLLIVVNELLINLTVTILRRFLDEHRVKVGLPVIDPGLVLRLHFLVYKLDPIEAVEPGVVHHFQGVSFSPQSFPGLLDQQRRYKILAEVTAKNVRLEFKLL